MHWLQIDVSDLAGRYDATREIESSGPVEGFRSGLGWIEDGDSVHVKLQSTSRIFGWTWTRSSTSSPPRPN
jgi:hypothetical protein